MNRAPIEEGRYSPDLISTIGWMMQADYQKRPSGQQLFEMAQAKLEGVDAQRRRELIAEHFVCPPLEQQEFGDWNKGTTLYGDSGNTARALTDTIAREINNL